MTPVSPDPICEASRMFGNHVDGGFAGYQISLAPEGGWPSEPPGG